MVLFAFKFRKKTSQKSMLRTCRHLSRKSLNGGESFFQVLILGLPTLAIRKRALKGGSSRYGGAPSIISMPMIPSDQMSTFLPENLGRSWVN